MIVSCWVFDKGLHTNQVQYVPSDPSNIPCVSFVNQVEISAFLPWKKDLGEKWEQHFCILVWLQDFCSSIMFQCQTFWWICTAGWWNHFDFLTNILIYSFPSYRRILSTCMFACSDRVLPFLLVSVLHCGKTLKLTSLFPCSTSGM